MLNRRSAKPGTNSGSSCWCAFPNPGGPIEVITYWPFGETCDMNPKRLTAGSELFPSRLSRNELHRITSWLRIVVSFDTGTSAYNPLSFFGPSMSSPSVLPSFENEWQLAHVGRFSITTRLWLSPMLRTRH